IGGQRGGQHGLGRAGQAVLLLSAVRGQSRPEARNLSGDVGRRLGPRRIRPPRPEGGQCKETGAAGTREQGRAQGPNQPWRRTTLKVSECPRSQRVQPSFSSLMTWEAECGVDAQPAISSVAPSVITAVSRSNPAGPSLLSMCNPFRALPSGTSIPA